MEKKDLEPAKFEMQTSDMLHQTLTNLAEGITGLVSSSRQDLTLSIGHLFQRLRGKKFPTSSWKTPGISADRARIPCLAGGWCWLQGVVPGQRNEGDNGR